MKHKALKWIIKKEKSYRKSVKTQGKYPDSRDVALSKSFTLIAGWYSYLYKEGVDIDTN